MNITRIMSGLGLGVLIGLGASNAAVAAYPAKPIHIVVPVTPGGTSDFFARLLAQRLGTRVEVPVVVENRPGAGGITGSVLVRRAPADGYTLLLASGGTHSINPNVYKDLPYDPIKDFEPVIRIATTANILVVNKDLPVNSVGELVKYGKDNPGKLAFASSGTGSSLHLTGELFKHLSGGDMLHVPYKGSAPAVTDLLGGQVSMMFDNMPSSLPQVQAGALKALAVTSSSRSASLPDVPTVEESGLAGFDLTTWFGLLAPAGTPADVVDFLSRHLSEILEEADVRRQFLDRGADVEANTPAQFASYMNEQLRKWKAVADIANVSME